MGFLGTQFKTHISNFKLIGSNSQAHKWQLGQDGITDSPRTGGTGALEDAAGIMLPVFPVWFDRLQAGACLRGVAYMTSSISFPFASSVPN